MTSTRSDIAFDRTALRAMSALNEIQDYLNYELELIQSALDELNSFNIDTVSVLDKVSTLVHDLSDLNGRQNTEFTYALSKAFRNVAHMDSYYQDESDDDLTPKLYLGEQV